MQQLHEAKNNTKTTKLATPELKQQGLVMPECMDLMHKQTGERVGA